MHDITMFTLCLFTLRFLCLINTLYSSRLVPIMLLKLPIMLWSNAPEFYPLCSNYAP